MTAGGPTPRRDARSSDPLKAAGMTPGGGGQDQRSPEGARRGVEDKASVLHALELRAQDLSAEGRRRPRASSTPSPRPRGGVAGCAVAEKNESFGGGARLTEHLRERCDELEKARSRISTTPPGPARAGRTRTLARKREDRGGNIGGPGGKRGRWRGGRLEVRAARHGAEGARAVRCAAPRARRARRLPPGPRRVAARMSSPSSHERGGRRRARRGAELEDVSARLAAAG